MSAHDDHARIMDALTRIAQALEAQVALSRRLLAIAEEERRSIKRQYTLTK